jgi:hypothetical protein
MGLPTRLNSHLPIKELTKREFIALEWLTKHLTPSVAMTAAQKEIHPNIKDYIHTAFKIADEFLKFESDSQSTNNNDEEYI